MTAPIDPLAIGRWTGLIAAWIAFGARAILLLRGVLQAGSGGSNLADRRTQHLSPVLLSAALVAPCTCLIRISVCSRAGA